MTYLLKPEFATAQYGGNGRVGGNIFVGEAAPTVDNDASDGCYPGDTFINTGSQPHTVYACTDNTDGAAVWVQIG